MEKIQITENMRNIIAVLQSATEPMTADDIAEKTGLTTKSVNASFNRIQNEKIGLGYREPAVQELGEGKIKEVKLLKLTEKGKSLNLKEDIVIKVK